MFTERIRTDFTHRIYRLNIAKIEFRFDISMDHKTHYA